jgi:hypothetical protein
VKLAQSIKCRSQVHYTLSIATALRKKKCASTRGCFLCTREDSYYMHLCCICCRERGDFLCTRARERRAALTLLQSNSVTCSQVLYCRLVHTSLSLSLSLTKKKHGQTQQTEKREPNAYNRISVGHLMQSVDFQAEILCYSPYVCMCVLLNIITTQASEARIFFHRVHM